ncbi:MAG: YqeG family HAD IIIA-type phosphatase [Faecousia sp.]
MPISFLPKVVASSLTEITPQWLQSQNIRLLMLDFDNTIVPYTTNEPTIRMEQWIREMLLSEIQICVVSNSKRDRVKLFCEKYGIPCITHAKKPFPKGIRQCLTRFGFSASEAALVGDQIFTDTLGANASGVTSILLKAIDNHNFWLKARHVLELPFIIAARKRRLKV